MNRRTFVSATTTAGASAVAAALTARAAQPGNDDGNPQAITRRLAAEEHTLEQASDRLERIGADLGHPPDPGIPAIRDALNGIMVAATQIRLQAEDMLRQL